MEDSSEKDDDVVSLNCEEENDAELQSINGPASSRTNITKETSNPKKLGRGKKGHKKKAHSESGNESDNSSAKSKKRKKGNVKQARHVVTVKTIVLL